MRQSVSLITLGVADYEPAKSFYAALGWSPALEIEETAVFQANDTRAHNVASRQEVDDVLARARTASGTITRAPSETFYGGDAGVLRDLDGHAWETARNPGFGRAADGSMLLGERG